MQADPKLGEAIGASLQLIITFHEGSKARRALAKRWCYGGIYEFFEEHSAKSGKWRWKLEKLAARYFLPVAVTLNGSKIDSKAGMLQLLQDAYKETLAVRKSFEVGYEVAEGLGVKPAKKRFGKLLDKCEQLIEEFEAYQRQVADSEKPGGKWLMEHM